jgi:2'-5' RNA ligase
VALAVCLLFDPETEEVVRRLWRRLEDQGLTTLLTHTHGHHVPHLTYALLLGCDRAAVETALSDLPERPPIPMHLEALGMFRRSRCWLAPAIPPGLAERQEAVVAAVSGTGAELHLHYRPGSWTPHVTLAPRLHLRDLPTVARTVNDVLPVIGTAPRVALIDTSTGERSSLPHLL